SGIKYLSTQINGSWGLQQAWSFWMGRRAQAATSANVAYVWLYASEADLTSATIDGYRIRFGDDAGGDELVLELVTNGVATVVLTSAGAVTNAITDFGLMVRVTRDVNGLWILYTSILPTVSGSGALATDHPEASNTNIVQGSVTNNILNIFDNGFIAVAALHSSAAAARGGLEFDQLALNYSSNIPLPVTFGNISSARDHNGVRISWNNLCESDILVYKVERADDGSEFHVVSTIGPVKNNGSIATYQYLDQSARDQDYFYRIAVKEKSGRMYYSKILHESHSGSEQSFDIYPNPLRGNQLEWRSPGLTPGNYNIRIYNSSGQVISTVSFHHSGGFFGQVIPLNELHPGCYLFEVLGPMTWKTKFVVLR
ncbi:MAG: T9SS type A sorting domain-containing protein, partial [Flavisolibacter sp.]